MSDKSENPNHADANLTHACGAGAGFGGALGVVISNFIGLDSGWIQAISTGAFAAVGVFVAIAISKKKKPRS